VNIRKWFKSRTKKPETEYDEAKREFEMAMGRPFISIKVEIPKGFEDVRADFLSLENNPDFIAEVQDLVKKRLIYEKRGTNEPT
jgi:hypothetical protein